VDDSPATTGTDGFLNTSRTVLRNGLDCVLTTTSGGGFPTEFPDGTGTVLDTSCGITGAAASGNAMGTALKSGLGNMLETMFGSLL
jgi:hypothetical protein